MWHRRYRLWMVCSKLNDQAKEPLSNNPNSSGPEAIFLRKLQVDQQTPTRPWEPSLSPVRTETQHSLLHSNRPRLRLPFFRIETGPTAWMTPIYPEIIARIFKVFGKYTYNAFLAAAILNILFSNL